MRHTKRRKPKYIGGNADIVRLLLDHGANVDIMNSHKETALVRAIFGASFLSAVHWLDGIELLKRYSKIIIMLYQAGADVTLTDSQCHSVIYNVLSILDSLNEYKSEKELFNEWNTILSDALALGSRFSTNGKDGDGFGKYRYFFEEHPEIMDSVLSCMDSPLSLKQLSRIVIRQCIHRPLEKNVKKLSIPKLIQGYITLNAN